MCSEPDPFEPLIPSDARLEPLLAKAHDLSRVATLIAGTRVPPELHGLAPRLFPECRTGRQTAPAVAHIEAEQALEQRYRGPDGAAARVALPVFEW
jgi:hypothetical protein